MPKAIIAMSGGVDSSVAAYIMKQKGYDIIGVTLKLKDDNILKAGSSCFSDDDIKDAKAVCDKLNIEHRVISFEADFQHEVVDRFVSAYINGSTPNPCIYCNRYIKFHHILKIAEQEGFDYVVTGHYACTCYDEKSGRYLLKKGIDYTKDQSYVLYSLDQNALKHIILPLGELSKAEVRKIAQEAKLPVFDKKDSQDICFIPNGKYADFISNYTGRQFEKGDFVDTSGNVLGKHNGIIRYTIGQRKGLNLSLPHPMYVMKKDVQSNTVTLCTDEELYTNELYAEDLNYISIEELTEPLKLKAKIRYKHTETEATVYKDKDERIRVVFDEPVRAVTKGQAVVMYIDDTVVCGGTII